MQATIILRFYHVESREVMIFNVRETICYREPSVNANFQVTSHRWTTELSDSNPKAEKLENHVFLPTVN